MVKQKGFTLIELLVVIAIIGILSSIVLSSLNTARERSKITRARADLKQILYAMNLLASDTGKYPNGCPIDSYDSAETTLNSVWAGLRTAPQLGADGTYSPSPGSCGWTAIEISLWKGPYVGNVIDPWGRPYFYDPDFEDTTGVPYPAIESWGPNGIQNYLSNVNSDDVVLFLR